MKKQAQKYQQDLDKVRNDIDNIGKQDNTTSGKPDELMDLKDLKTLYLSVDLWRTTLFLPVLGEEPIARTPKRNSGISYTKKMK